MHRGDHTRRRAAPIIALALILAGCGSGPLGNSADGYYIDPSEVRNEIAAENAERGAPSATSSPSTTTDPAIVAENCAQLRDLYNGALEDSEVELDAAVDAWEAFADLAAEFEQEYGIPRSPQPRLNEMMYYRIATNHRTDAVEYGCDWPDLPSLHLPDGLPSK